MIELFNPVIEKEKWHQNFEFIANEEEPFARDVLNEWAQGFKDRDGKFAIEFQSTFNSSFWELYLHACLKYLAYKIDFSHSRPDFIVNANSHQIIVEAVTANHPLDAAPEWDREEKIKRMRNQDLGKIVNLSTIRLANAITAKHRILKEKYLKLDHVRGKPFILAVAPFEQPLFFNQVNQAITRVLFAQDKINHIDNDVTGERTIIGIETMYSIEKDNGTEIGLGFFLSEEMCEISAVLFSNCATFGKVRALSNDNRDFIFKFKRYNANGLHAVEGSLSKADYKETLLDGLQIYHNPFAKHPLKRDLFSHEDITHIWIEKDGEFCNSPKDGALLQRAVMKFQRE